MPLLQNQQVAPLVGAWIETSYSQELDHQDQSHPSWVRGLKRIKHQVTKADKLSHPSWVRGLKHSLFCLVSCEVSRTPRGCVD